MSLTEQSIRSRNSLKSTKEIQNLEFLEYIAQKLNDIMKYKDLIQFYPKVRKQVINIQRWKILRNCLIVLIYICLIFAKPDWCNNLGSNIGNGCERQINKGYHFYT